MTHTDCEREVLRRLAEMPFLDRLELAALTGRSRGAVYAGVDRLRQRGMVDAIPHASPLIPPFRRYCLTAGGLRGLAGDEGVTVDQLLDTRPVSARWRRVLLERLDALAVIHRVAAALSNAAFPVGFRWCRAGPTDAGILLPGGRCLAVVRQGNAADRATFAKRLWRLSEEARPGAVLLLVPDDVRLRQASRALDSLPLLGFLAREGDAARGDAGSQVWRTPSGPVPLSLREVLDYVRPGGELPGQTPPRRDSLPADLGLDSAGNDAPVCLLPSLLKPVEKRALDLLSDWPWLQPAHLGQLMGVGRTRLYQVLERLRTCLQSLKYDKLRRLPEGGVIMSHSYPSDISREQFTRILPDLESARRRTKPRTVDLYDVFCGVLYLLKSGCQWRMLPADFPNWGTCYQYFQQWSERPDPEQESILEQVLKKIGWRGPEKQWSERAEQLLHRGLPERQEHGQRRAEGL